LLSSNRGEIKTEKRIWASIDWNKVPKGEIVNGKIIFSTGDSSKTVNLKIFNPESPTREEIKGFVESHGYICMEAEHYNRQTDRDGCKWKIIYGLGRSGNSIAIYPPTASSRKDIGDIMQNSPVLEYDIHIFNPENVLMTAFCIPAFRINADHAIRFAVSVDDKNPQIVTFDNKSRSVLDNIMYLNSTLDIQKSGAHTLKIWMVDPGVIIDRLVLYTSQKKDSYSGPPESFHN
jgi:hypothetical protein